MTENKNEKKTKAPQKRKLFSKSKAGEKAKATMADYNVLRMPIVTEKSSIISSKSASGPGTAFALKVDVKASKTEIKNAIERIYNVDVIKVNTINYMGKVKRARRSEGRQDKFKKAYVTLKEGQTINMVEGL